MVNRSPLTTALYDGAFVGFFICGGAVLEQTLEGAVRLPERQLFEMPRFRRKGVPFHLLALTYNFYKPLKKAPNQMISVGVS